MEPSPKRQSFSKFLKLDVTENLLEYCLLLEKVLNSPNKYVVVDNTVKRDCFGSPFIVFHYMDNLSEPEREKPKYNVRGNIISFLNLEGFDSVVTKDWEGSLKLIFVDDFSVRDKDTVMMYKVILFVTPVSGYTMKIDELGKIKPSISN